MADGKRLKAYPIHLVYRIRSQEEGERSEYQLAFSAPKRIHRSAVTRNRLKRLMREAISPSIKQIGSFVLSSGLTIDLMFIYVGREEAALVDIKGKIKVLLSRLEEHSKSPTSDEPHA